jgi:DEAD/DEAH box helicase domain-containing protein
LSERLHDLWDELLGMCRDAVRDCSCTDGCPGCVGPPTEVGARGKVVALELLTELAATSG